MSVGPAPRGAERSIQSPVAGMNDRIPIRVAQCELDGLVTDIDCAPRNGVEYHAAWILVLHRGRPISNFELPVTDGRVSAQVLRDAVAAAFPELPAVPQRLDPDLLPRVSVVVPSAMARIEELKASVARLTALDYPDFEVIVVDNHRGEHPEVALPGARVVREPRPGISAARNTGVAAATGDIVAFTDDDVEVDAGWLRAIAECFVAHPEISGVTGLVLPHELETDAQLWFEQYYGLDVHREYSPLKFERSGAFSVMRTNISDGTERIHSLYKLGELGIGANMAFRTAVLRDAGGFDLALGAGTPAQAGEETAMMIELLMKRHTLAYEPAAYVWHKHRTSVEALERQIYGYGSGFTARMVALMLRNPAHALGVALLVPMRLAALRHRDSGEPVSRRDEFLAHLHELELSGTVVGPLRYLRGRRIQRRWGRARAIAPAARR